MNEFKEIEVTVIEETTKEMAPEKTWVPGEVTDITMNNPAREGWEPSLNFHFILTKHGNKRVKSKFVSYHKTPSIQVELGQWISLILGSLPKGNMKLKESLVGKKCLVMLENSEDKGKGVFQNVVNVARAEGTPPAEDLTPEEKVAKEEKVEEPKKEKKVENKDEDLF